MNIKNLHTIYFLGIGGIGMSALARYFLATDCKVYGYDKTKTALTEQLEKEGMIIHYEDNIDFLKELFSSNDCHPEPVEGFSRNQDSLFCYTPAIPSDNKEFQYLREQGIRLYKRSEVLGLISENYFTIAVAGTHGKTTTSSIIAHILNECNVNCIAFLGGISLNFNSNLLLNNDAQIMIVEADEFDRSFLTLSPDIALITSIDADHLDVYGNKEEMQNAYSEFARKIKQNGKLITKKEYIDELNIRSDVHTTCYSATKTADVSATNISIKNGYYVVDINLFTTTIKKVKIGLPGIHNVENAIGAFAIADKMGVDKKQIKEALGSYKGVYRRFETHIKTKDLVYIDDYAHHPSELEMCIQSAKELYPNKKITGIFQPHLYSRTRDFTDEFARSLSLLDELILMDIYPARELPIDGITSEIILNKVSITEKSIVSKADLLAVLAEQNIEVLLTMGAGDIDVFVQPIKEQLSKRVYE